MRRLHSVIFLACALPALAVMGEDIYRSEDAEGNITFTDNPLPNDPTLERVELPPGPSEESLRHTEQRNREIQNAVNESERKRQQYQQGRQARIKEAEERLAKAEANLSKAKVIQDEDRQHLAGGKRRIQPGYFERVKAAEAQLEAARKALKEARGY
ncbi:MAG: DUF4124 domain-containing protein [Candidatus Thiodiazotropha sp.]